jgi:hypothetical protein
MPVVISLEYQKVFFSAGMNRAINATTVRRMLIIRIFLYSMRIDLHSVRNWKNASAKI